jgi:hypothetical protein
MKINKCSSCGENHGEISLFDFSGKLDLGETEKRYNLFGKGFICPKTGSIVLTLDEENRIGLTVTDR